MVALSSVRDVDQGKPLPHLVEPRKGSVPMPRGSIGGNPSHTHWNPGKGSVPMSG
jgi:hypothetical protein